jgi:hypothetical protein
MKELLPFERWARISAALSVTGDDLRETHLERWGFTAEEWALQEEAWGRTIADDLASGKTERAFAYARMCAALRSAPAQVAPATPDGGDAEDDPEVDADVTRFGASLTVDPTLPFGRSPVGDRIAALRAQPPSTQGEGPTGARHDRDGPPTEASPSRGPVHDAGLPFQPKRGS